jgi:transposase
MAKQLIAGELWAVIEPLLPPDPPSHKDNRPRLARLFSGACAKGL